MTDPPERLKSTGCCDTEVHPLQQLGWRSHGSATSNLRSVLSQGLVHTRLKGREDKKCIFPRFSPSFRSFEGWHGRFQSPCQTSVRTKLWLKRLPQRTPKRASGKGPRRERVSRQISTFVSTILAQGKKSVRKRHKNLGLGDKIQGPPWGQQKWQKPPFTTPPRPRFEWLEVALNWLKSGLRWLKSGFRWTNLV